VWSLIVDDGVGGLELLPLVEIELIGVTLLDG
jgi:hypothetical protein